MLRAGWIIVSIKRWQMFLYWKKNNAGIIVCVINRLENVEQMERRILSASRKGLKFCISDANH